jgi:16S rRNA processing protein RimM
MIEIAKVLKPHGINGEVKVQLFSDNLDDFGSRGFAYLKQGGSFERIDYEEIRREPPFVYLRIQGIDTRNGAESLQGAFLYLEKDDLPETQEGEYYVFDLIGLEVTDTAGNKLGVIKDVLQHGAADVYAVGGDKDFMFPALKRVIQRVDTAAGVMVVDEKALSEVAVYDDI